jgi:hypothetical protein
MANSAARVINGKPVAAGGVALGPLGTTLPETATSDLDPALIRAGYISEDGVTKSESRDTNELKDWGGLTVKKSTTGFAVTLQFQFLEYLNPVGARAVYGDQNVTVTAATEEHGELMKIAVTAADAPHLAWVFDMADGTAHLKVLISDGQITEVGDTPYSNSDGAVRDVTVSAFPDEDGVYVYELTDDGRKTPAVTTQNVGSLGS